MNILFISHFYPPESGAASKRISGLARNLKKLGHNVEVLTGFPSYPTGIKEPEYKGKFYMEDEIDGIKIYRYCVFSSPKRTKINRALNYFTFMLSSMFFVFKKKKYDVIIASSPPIFIGIPACFISSIKKVPLVFDIRDIWPDIAYEMGAIDKKSLVYRILDNLSNFIYKKSKMITVVTKGKKKKLITKGIEENKIKVISNGFDKEFLQNDIDVELIRKYNLEEKFTLLYAGLIGLAQGLGMIIDTAEMLQEYEDIQFLIIGDGPEKPKLEKDLLKRNIKNVVFIGLMPHEKIYTFLKYSKASIVPLINEKLQDSVPTKMLESLGAGCPVILSAKGESEKILLESQGGICIEPNDSNALREGILYLYKNQHIETNMGANGQEYVLSNYTRESIAKKLNVLLNEQI